MEEEREGGGMDGGRIKGEDTRGRQKEEHDYTRSRWVWKYGCS